MYSEYPVGWDIHRIPEVVTTSCSVDLEKRGNHVVQGKNRKKAESIDVYGMQPHELVECFVVQANRALRFKGRNSSSAELLE